MGLGDFVRKQFLDVIQWTEDNDDVLSWRFPTADLEIQQGAELTVRETQVALFVDEGKVADQFGPGRHKLHTRNLPVLTNLRHWDKRFESPFKSEVYFFSTRLHVGQTWGTTQAVTVRDKEFGAVRIRAFGVYNFRVANVARFFQAAGTRQSYTVTEIEGQLRATLVNALAQLVGASGVPFIDMAANQTAFAAGIRDQARLQFETIGLELESVQIQSISLPSELQQRLDERIGMGVVGDMARYAQFQAARAIPIVAAGTGGSGGIGGAASAGIGIGAGVALGQTMAQTIVKATTPAGGQSVPATPAAPAPEATVACGQCGANLQRRTPFCPECGTRLA